MTVGETFQDLIFVGLPRVPRPGEELHSAGFMDTVGGGAAITAIGAARLGLRAATISAMSTAAERVLRRERVAVTNLRRRSERHAVTVALSTTRDRAFATFGGVNATLQPRLASAVARVRAAHVHFAFPPKRCVVWARIAARLRARGTTTSWDFGWDPGLPRRSGFHQLIKNTDFVFVNKPESKRYAPAVRAAAALIVKMGPRGSRWVTANRTLRSPARRVRVVDTTGAGDAFNAGFLFAFLRGRSPQACLAFGNEVGARSTRGAGGIDALPSASVASGRRFRRRSP